MKLNTLIELIENDEVPMVTKVVNDIEAAEKKEEIEVITFGLETADNEIVKVYVDKECADDFEVALGQRLSKEDDIETILNDLSTEFNIVDVDWPDEPTVDDEEALPGGESITDITDDDEPEFKVKRDDVKESIIGDYLQEQELTVTGAGQTIVNDLLEMIFDREFILKHRMVFLEMIRTRGNQIQKDSKLKMVILRLMKYLRNEVVSEAIEDNVKIEIDQDLIALFRWIGVDDAIIKLAGQQSVISKIRDLGKAIQNKNTVSKLIKSITMGNNEEIVAEAADENEKKNNLNLSNATQRLIYDLLDLLGIPNQNIMKNKQRYIQIVRSKAFELMTDTMMKNMLLKLKAELKSAVKDSKLAEGKIEDSTALKISDDIFAILRWIGLTDEDFKYNTNAFKDNNRELSKKLINASGAKYMISVVLDLIKQKNPGITKKQKAIDDMTSRKKNND